MRTFLGLCIVGALTAVFIRVAYQSEPPPPAPPPAPPVTTPPTHSEYIARLTAADLTDTLLVRGWLASARDALREPALIRPPHEERGAFVPHDVRAVGLAFDVTEGQTLQIDIERSTDSAGRLFAQLFYVDPLSVETPFLSIATLTDKDTDEVVLPHSGRYVLRLQPELHAAIDYRVRVELDAALSFPVKGHTRRSIQSFFGDVRDGGRRRHEGVDVFAARGTPVLAVTDGVATPRQSRRGGNTVWLRGNDRSFYFAHLDTVAIERHTAVKAGDVLGTIGNTGNARTTPPHLHFGIYQRGRGALDPYPYLESFRFRREPAPSVYERGFVAVTANRLNLRVTPRIQAESVRQLSAGALLEARAAAGDWLRVQHRDGTSGWIKRRYQHPAEANAAPQSLGRNAWLRATPRGQAVDRLRATDEVYVFTNDGGWSLIGRQADKPLGWLPTYAFEPVDSSS
ncbi:MAG: M23 family metallopeptidase [Pseudomonadota bacterium]